MDPVLFERSSSAQDEPGRDSAAEYPISEQGASQQGNGWTISDKLECPQQI